MTEKTKELSIDDHIKYNAFNPPYGRAYFSIGVKRKQKGVITELHLIRNQQPDEKIQHYIYKPSNEHTGFTVEKAMGGQERPNHFKTAYCEKHDLVEEHWSVPDHTNTLEIKEYGSGLEITFKQEK